MKKSHDSRSLNADPQSVVTDESDAQTTVSVGLASGVDQDFLCLQSLGPLMHQWDNEHQDLSRNIRETTLWLGQVSQRGIPRFGELAARLSLMRQRMKQHFDREETLGRDLQQVSDCLEVKMTRRRAISDHQHLTQRIDDLIAKLSELEPPFESFQQAIDQVGLFVDAFEQHEEQEAQGLQWLTNYNSDPRRMPR